MEKPIKMDDLGVPLFSETSIYDTKAKKTSCTIFCPGNFAQESERDTLASSMILPPQKNE